MANSSSDSCLIDGCHRISSPDDTESEGVGDRPRNSKGPLAEWLHFKHTHRSVPENRFRCPNLIRKDFYCFRPNIKTDPIAWNLLIVNNRSLCFAIHTLCSKVIRWKDKLDLS